LLHQLSIDRTSALAKPQIRARVSKIDIFEFST
jgi:hypothetical protein